MPEDAKDIVGFALESVQHGRSHPDVKPLKGFAGVFEIAADVEGDAYRVVYVGSLPDAIYVVHAFKKKSTRASSTPRKHLDVIRARLKRAQEVSRERR